jgi:hypothetical protein
VRKKIKIIKLLRNYYKNDFDNEKNRDLDNPATVMRTEKGKVALEQCRRLETGEISRATYMKSMGLQFSTRTDL